MNIFERASRSKLRFASSIGMLSAEQLWDLPLTENRRDRPDLDKIARNVNTELKGVTEDSFVQVNPDPRKADLELSLEIVKHIIASKIAAAKTAETAAINAERKRKLYAALAQKEEAELTGMSRSDIEAEIAKIGG